MVLLVIFVLGVFVGCALGWIAARRYSRKGKAAKKHNAASSVSDGKGRQLPEMLSKRMLEQEGRYGLLMTSGHMIEITKVVEISEDRRWIDVALAAVGGFDGREEARPIRCTFGVGSGKGRLASLQVSNIAAAAEVTSTP